MPGSLQVLDIDDRQRRPPGHSVSILKRYAPAALRWPSARLLCPPLHVVLFLETSIFGPHPLPLVKLDHDLGSDILDEAIDIDIEAFHTKGIFKLACNAIDTIEREDHQDGDRNRQPAHLVNHGKREDHTEEGKDLFLMDAGGLAASLGCVLTDGPPESGSSGSFPSCHKHPPGCSAGPSIDSRPERPTSSYDSQL